MHLTLSYPAQSGGRFFTRGNKRGYCFGFNGQMKDDEVYGEGNSYTAEYWQYDPRLGRRWNIDPVDQISISNYACFRNNPIYFVDIKGNFNTKAGAWLYRLFYGKKGDQIYKKDGSDIWVIGRQSEESHQEQFINEMTGEQTVLTTISVEEITKWNNEARGGIHSTHSGGFGTEAGADTHGDPSHQIDLKDLGIFGTLLPRETVMNTFKRFIKKTGSKDASDFAEAVEIMYNLTRGGKKAADGIKKANDFFKSNEDDGRTPTTTFPDSLDKAEILGGWATFKKGTNDTVQKYLDDPDRKNSDTGKTLLQQQNEK